MLNELKISINKYPGAIKVKKVPSTPVSDLVSGTGKTCKKLLAKLAKKAAKKKY